MLGRFTFLSRAQVETLHRNALRVLTEIGVRVEHEELVKRLRSVGGTVNSAGHVQFTSCQIERNVFEGSTQAAELDPMQVFVGVYQSWYLDPETGRCEPFTEDRLARYIGLAARLPLISHTHVLGLPFVPNDLPVEFLPLAEKLYAWKHGARPGGSVQHTSLAEPLIQMFHCHAEMSGQPLEKIFRAEGYLITPLKLARPECEQFLFFADRGLRMRLGHLPSQGGTAPVTFAGAITLALAEQLFLHLVNRAIWPDTQLSLSGEVMTMDPRTGVSRYGRPEQQRINAAFADLARFYQCGCTGHTGLSDALAPSVEAGAQKAMGALMTALATGTGTIEAGLLATDEICSPLQMVLDHDLAGALSALLKEPVVSDADCLVEEIRRIGSTRHFLDSELTASRCREEFFLPRTWSTQSLSSWRNGVPKIDIDLARDLVRQFTKEFSSTTGITQEEERELRKIMRAAIRCGTQ
ncbi:MAG: trimethylamine methyltransferase family protein [Acidobacteriota bacterium]